MSASRFLCVFLICIAVSHGYHSNIDFKSKNGTILTKSTNDIDTSLTIFNTEFFDKEKKIVAHKNVMTKECVLTLVDYQANIIHFKNNYDQNMELTEDEMVEIIGENLRNFCKDKIIILNNFDNKRFSRSKRSTDKKRYQGQTQTQFVSFGSKTSNQEAKNGLAEALSQPDLSRATVSGLNGMGQAQSQSSFSDCDDCSGQDYRAHSTHVDNSHTGHFPSLRPISSVPQNQNSRPYSESNTNRQSPGSQNEESQRGHSINDQYPDTYPGSGINNLLPANQVHGYGVRPSVNGQYPGSGTNNKLPGNQDQGYGVSPSIVGQNPGSGTNNKIPGNQDQGYGTNPSIDGQYPGSGINNKLPGNQDQGYGIRPSIDGQYQGSRTNNKIPGNQDQGYGITPSIDGQYQGSRTNNKVPGNQDQGYGISPSIVGQYPDTGTNNNLSGNQERGYGNVPSLYGQYPGKNEGSGSNNNTELGKIDSGHTHSSASDQNRNLVNANSPESKKVVNNNVVNPNTYSINPSPFNPSSWSYPNKITNNNPNVDQQIYLDGSGFPNVPPGPGHEILTPHYIPNSEWISPSYNPQVPTTTSIEHQNKPSNYPSNLIPNYQQNFPNVLGQLTPNKPISSDRNSQNEQKIKNDAAGTILTGYPLSSNIHGGQDYTQLNLPSLCNFLYQTCLNALSNNKRLNEFQITSSQNNEKNPNEVKQADITQQQGYPLYGGQNNQNQIQPSSSQPLYTIGSGGTGVQQPGYVQSGGNLNQMQPNYGQPQGTSDFGGSGIQQSGYVPPGGNVNQIQPNYGQPQNTLGFGGPGYNPSGGNINQIQPSYGQPQGTLGSSSTGTHQPGYVQSLGNVNQMQPNFGQPQGAFGTGGSVFQPPGYTPLAGNINQMQPNYGRPQGPLDLGGSGFQQPGYVPSGGNVNQMQPNYGKSQGTLGSAGAGVQQPGYAPSGGNANQIQPTYGKPQGTLGSGESGFQQPGYNPSSGNINQMQPSYGQPQGILGSGESGFRQPGYNPSDGNINQMQPSYGQPQGTLGSRESDFQRPGYVPSGGNVNQMQPSYGKPQGTLGSGEAGVQQPGYNSSRLPQSYPESYGDNSFRGPSLRPGSEMENINPSPNPIIGGQFGTDISSGGSVTPIDTEGGDAQSMTNVDVDGHETRASASAQGKSKTGMSQTQVSGSYLGTGTFSAQAQTSDSDKGAQSQIVSNTNGTTSSAQGKGGKGQAQSQVLYNADNGIALGEAQSSGINYGTNTQLQAGIKGGVADAQSTGPGSTSSQAQIGFLPHESNNSTNQKSLFKGGGATSAQAGSYSGQSQSQLFGSYKHGISYNGAAQASTGKKLQNLPKLNLADAKLKIGQLEGSNIEIKNQTDALQNLKSVPNLIQSQNKSEISNVDYQKQQNISSTQTPSILPQESSKNVDVYPEYEDNDEYDEDSDEIVNTKSVETKKETIPKQEQNIILKLDDKHDAQITRDSDSQLKSGQVLDAGQVIPGTNGTKIPNGFRGIVASVAGDHTEAKAIPGGQAQTQTVFLTPGIGSLTVVDKTKLRAQLNKESYVSPTNKFQTEINGGIGKYKPYEKNVQYFTKSSTCGYFSFSCNYVNGKDGAKICKPNPPPFPCQGTKN
ncbi:uncharacterized protein LOC111040907 [Myzus persicae]|uniref:uncharacterized protein LOC111040907 n=1 Tax=Myzus persicae TaxID=13164 RepID=UPI000B939741|nr:uncharacterized protein LOC111040907 [Myzus persicae]